MLFWGTVFTAASLFQVAAPKHIVSGYVIILHSRTSHLLKWSFKKYLVPTVCQACWGIQEFTFLMQLTS